jgi:hypothetical protein
MLHQPSIQQQKIKKIDVKKTRFPSFYTKHFLKCAQPIKSDSYGDLEAKVTHFFTASCLWFHGSIGGNIPFKIVIIKQLAPDELIIVTQLNEEGAAERFLQSLVMTSQWNNVRCRVNLLERGPFLIKLLEKLVI